MHIGANRSSSGFVAQSGRFSLLFQEADGRSIERC